MLYQINRNGQTYGPYTLYDLQRYLGTGNVLPGDLAKSDDMPDWLPVSQIVAPQPAAPAAAAYTVPAPGPVYYPHPADAAPAFASIPGTFEAPAGADPNAYPDAPNLHWGLTILFSILGVYAFTFIWDVVIAAWLRRVQPTDRSLFWYLAALVVYLFRKVIHLSIAASVLSHQANPGNLFTAQFLGLAALSNLASIAMLTFIITANFIKRRSLLEHFNGPEPIGLELSGVMTFFFAPWYFQYHLNRINALKKASRYAAPGAY